MTIIKNMRIIKQSGFFLATLLLLFVLTPAVSAQTSAPGATLNINGSTAREMDAALNQPIPAGTFKASMNDADGIQQFGIVAVKKGTDGNPNHTYSYLCNPTGSTTYPNATVDFYFNSTTHPNSNDLATNSFVRNPTDPNWVTYTTANHDGRYCFLQGGDNYFNGDLYNTEVFTLGNKIWVYSTAHKGTDGIGQRKVLLSATGVPVYQEFQTACDASEMNASNCHLDTLAHFRGFDTDDPSSDNFNTEAISIGNKLWVYSKAFRGTEGPGQRKVLTPNGVSIFSEFQKACEDAGMTESNCHLDTLAHFKGFDNDTDNFEVLSIGTKVWVYGKAGTGNEGPAHRSVASTTVFDEFPTACAQAVPALDRDHCVLTSLSHYKGFDTEDTSSNIYNSEVVTIGNKVWVYGKTNSGNDGVGKRSVISPPGDQNNSTEFPKACTTSGLTIDTCKVRSLSQYKQFDVETATAPTTKEANSLAWTPTEIGDYYVLVDAIDTSNNKCTGKASEIGYTLPSNETRCDATDHKDYVIVHVKNQETTDFRWGYIGQPVANDHIKTCNDLATLNVSFQPYTSFPVSQTQNFPNLTPGDRVTVCAQYKDNTGKLSEIFTNYIIYIGEGPLINNLSCDLDTSTSKLTFVFNGNNFGRTQQGPVTIGGQDANITAWSDTQITATISSNAPKGADGYVAAVKIGDQTYTRTCQLGTLKVNLGPRFMCRFVNSNDLPGTEVKIVESGVGGKQILATSSAVIAAKRTDRDGGVINLNTTISDSKLYKISVKPQKGLRRNAYLSGVNISDTSGGNVSLIPIKAKNQGNCTDNFDGYNYIIPFGDVYTPNPPERFDKIDTFDYSTLKRQWGISSGPQNADFNGDKKVNSFDYACQRFDIGACDDDPVAPDISTTNIACTKDAQCPTGQTCDANTVNSSVSTVGKCVAAEPTSSATNSPTPTATP